MHCWIVHNAEHQLQQVLISTSNCTSPARLTWSLYCKGRVG